MFKIIDLMLMFMILVTVTTALGVNMPTMASNTSVTQYVTLTINIIGNGSLTVYFHNFTTITLNHSATFKVPVDEYVYIYSNKSFFMGKGTMISNWFGENITANTTWNVNFNVQNIVLPPSEYAEVKIEVENISNIILTIHNETAVFYYTTLNSSETLTLMVPKGSTITFTAVGENFSVNGESAEFIKNADLYEFNYHNVENSITFIITPGTLITITSTITTSTLPRTTVITLPVSNTTITAHTGTVIATSTTSRGVSPVVYAIIAVIVVILVAFLVLRMMRK